MPIFVGCDRKTSLIREKLIFLQIIENQIQPQGLLEAGCMCQNLRYGTEKLIPPFFATGGND